MGDEAQAAFVGVDPDDTATVEHHGARFVVGIVDYGRWNRIHAELRYLYRDALRSAIKRLREAGEDPDREVLPAADGRPALTAAQFDALSEPEYLERLHRVQLQAVRYALRSFTGWKKRDGTDVPCKFTEERVDGQIFRVVDEETLRHFAVNRPLLLALWPAIQRLQEVTDAEKKA